MAFELPIRIRQARETDAAALATLIWNYGQEHRLNLGFESVMGMTETHLKFCLSSEEHTTLIAEDTDGGIVGYTNTHWVPFLYYPGREGYISELLVDRVHRGQGVGHRLVSAVEQEARKRGCYRLMLNNFRAAESYRRGFYEKLGFKEGELIYFTKVLAEKEDADAETGSAHRSG